MESVDYEKKGGNCGGNSDGGLHFPGNLAKQKQYALPRFAGRMLESAVPAMAECGVAA